jgi:hypothetical protein
MSTEDERFGGGVVEREVFGDENWYHSDYPVRYAETIAPAVQWYHWCWERCESEDDIRHDQRWTVVCEGQCNKYRDEGWV